MKKIFLLSLFIVIAFSGISQAQEVEPISTQTFKKNIVKVNLLSLVARTGSFFYERVITDTKSAQLGFYYTGYGVEALGVSTSYTGMGITPEFRFYLSANQKAPQGFYVAPFGRYQKLNLTSTYIDTNNTRITNTGSFSSMGAGLSLGGHFIFSDILSLDVFGGPCYNSIIDTKFNGKESEIERFGGVGFRAGVTLGLAF